LNILIITFGYPSVQHPDNAPFVEQIAVGLAKIGVKITVIHPVKMSLMPGSLPPEVSTERYDTHTIRVLRPRFLSFSSIQLGKWNSYNLTSATFGQAVNQALKGLDESPDVIYAHFLFPGGLAAVRVGQRLGIPVFIGSGESYLERMGPHFEKYGAELRKASTIIAVSQRNKRLLENRFGFAAEKVLVLNNGVDVSLYHSRDRRAARSRWHLPQDKFIVGYVGSFTHRKGVLRLMEALAGLEDVAVILVGAGPLKPKGKKIVFLGKLEHNRIPELLAAADIFVLPTTGEGCSNAIIEALACGLPVISSNREYNDDILTDAVSLRVDPEDIEAIRQAITTLRDDTARRQQMSEKALVWVKENFDIDNRAKNIYSLMENSLTTFRMNC
jgi:glycosyltransferase involved in cell wall biosynthesis